MSPAADQIAKALAERARLKRLWPTEFAHGERSAFHKRGGYPPGFAAWPLERRNSWFAGFNCGLVARRRVLAERVDE